MEKVVVLYKPRSWTPLQTIRKFQELHPEYREVALGYAGRLDPMAEGLLLVLVGEENKKQGEYLHLDKTYEVEVLFGVETDSYDILGHIIKMQPNIEIDEEHVKAAVSSFVGKHMQAYPPYSAVRVGGKPLMWWTRRGRLHEVAIPSKEREVYRMELQGSYAIQKDDLETYIAEGLAPIGGNFDVENIRKQWQEFFETTSLKEFKIFKIHIECSSGTYIRSLVHELGKKLGCGAIATKLIRTRVGTYELKDSLQLA